MFTALVALFLAVSLATSADARRWRWWYYGGYDRSDRLERAGRDDSGGSRRTRGAEFASARGPRSGGPFGAVVERLISGCTQQADQLAHLPIADIARIAAPDEAQRATLEALRAVATQTSDRLGADCPQSVPVAPEVRLAAVEQAIDAASAAFTAIEPALQQFYAALDDEQKARLLRDLTLAPQPRVSDADRSRDRVAERAERWDRRSYRSRRSYEADSNSTDGMGSDRTAALASSAAPCRERRSSSRGCQPNASTTSVNRWAAVCEDLTTALRNWPIGDIERGVRLSEPQRVAFYELVTASLRAASRSDKSLQGRV